MYTHTHNNNREKEAVSLKKGKDKVYGRFWKKKRKWKHDVFVLSFQKFKKCFNFDVQKLQEKQEIQIIL